MKIKLEMIFDIPEDLYRDDEEDKDVPIEELESHHLGFIRQFLFDEFINFAVCKRLLDNFEFLEQNQRDKLLENKKWIKIIQDAARTTKYTVQKD